MVNNKIYMYRWLLAVIIFSTIMLLLQIILNNDINYTKDFETNKTIDIQELISNTPSYPPPLRNFID